MTFLLCKYITHVKVLNYVSIYVIGAKPSPNIVNTYPPGLGPRKPPEPEPPQKEDPTIATLSDTIQKLRRQLIEEKLKNVKSEEENQTLMDKNEKLRIALHKKKIRVKKLMNQKVSDTEKKQIVHEMLSETKFTKVISSVTILD